jgi:hypothetical protein
MQLLPRVAGRREFTLPVVVVVVVVVVVAAAVVVVVVVVVVGFKAELYAPKRFDETPPI